MKKRNRGVDDDYGFAIFDPLRGFVRLVQTHEGKVPVGGAMWCVYASDVEKMARTFKRWNWKGGLK